MARTGSAELVSALSGPLDHHYEMDLFYDGTRRLQNVPCMDVAFSEDGDAVIQQSGSLTIVWQSKFGETIAPSEVGDILAPFGAQIHLYAVVEIGTRLRERVRMGVFEISNVPSIVDEDMLFQGQWVTVNSEIQIEFKELMAAIDRDRFDVPYAPTDLRSTWAELARLTTMPLVRSLPDLPISRAVVYEESRTDGVHDLIENLGGIPHFVSDGSLSARPIAWGEPVDILKRGNGGVVLSVGRAMSRDQVYNRVAVRGKTADQTSILAVVQITEGPLRVSNSDGSPSPFRRVTYYLSSEYVTTSAQAYPWAQSQLDQVSQLKAVEVPVTELWNPLRERGDVVLLQRDRKTLLCRVKTITRSAGSKTQDLKLEVQGG